MAFSKNQLERYPVYLKYFKELQETGFVEISSPKIAERLGYSEEQVRKDLQAISTESGKPKRGRSLSQLIDDLEDFLGYREPTGVILIGAGHLGGALLNYPAFDDMGIRILAAFDISPSLIGETIGGKPIYDMKDFPEVVARLDAKIAMITTPADSAQQAAELCFENGILGIWNFAPTSLSLPEEATIVDVNLASSLAVLSHQLGQRAKKN